MINREVDLLSRMIAIPSPSRQESEVTDMLHDELLSRGIRACRVDNNLWAISDNYHPSRPTLMLNSHCDTVRPVDSWTRDPFIPAIEDGRLYGLGSNDAGASVVSLISLFEEFKSQSLPFNLLLAITAQEEVMGPEGMRGFLPHITEKEGIEIDMAIVGEPTRMHPAVGERGLVVLDAVSEGVSGHAARGEGINALYKAIADIEKLRRFRWLRQSSLLGPITLNVTQIEAGSQHNVIPDKCRWVVDIRTTDAYSNPEVVEILQKEVESTLTPRSTRVWASALPLDHPMVEAAIEAGRSPFVSPTTSDMALMHNIPSMKIGPGESSRSHTADEYVLLDELEEAAVIYRKILQNIRLK